MKIYEYIKYIKYYKMAELILGNILDMVFDSDENLDENVEMKSNSDGEREQEDVRLDQQLDILFIYLLS
jgi:hypothetical protein